MAFWSRKKKDEDIKAVKEAVSETPMPAPMPEAAMLPGPTIELEKSPDRPRFAPLFIKIDRYNEVLRNIENVKNILLNLRDLLSLSQQLEKTRTETQTLLQKNVQEIAKYTADLDKEFVRPRGMEFTSAPRASFETERVEEYVGELERELQNLRTQLQEPE